MSENEARTGEAEAVEAMDAEEIAAFDRWAEARRGKGASLGMQWALRLRATLAYVFERITTLEAASPAATENLSSDDGSAVAPQFPAVPRPEGLDVVAFIRDRIKADPTTAWPGEIDDILDDAEARLAEPTQPEEERHLPVRDGPSCPDCGLPNYEGLCPVCRGNEDEVRAEGLPYPWDATQPEPTP